MTLRNTGLKLIIAFVVVVLAVLVFNINQVSAVDSEVPDTLEVGISTKEACNGGFVTDKLKDTITTKIPNADVSYKFENVDGSKSTLLDISKITINGKIVTLKYTDTNWSDTDKQYVEEKLKNTNLNNDNLEYDVSIYENAENFLQSKISEIINDTTIKCDYKGNLGTWGFEEGFELQGIANYSKNNVIYYAGWTSHKATPVITIPTNIENTDQAFIDYATKIITQKIKDNGNNYEFTLSVLKDTNDFIYTYKDSDINTSSKIILKQDKTTETKPTEVTNTDTTTKIKLDTTTEVVPAGTTLVAEKVTSGTSYNTVVKAVEKDVSKFEMYDISLMNNNAKIQPNGKVKVSIPVPSGFEASKIVVYRVADDGTKTKLDANVKDGYVVFETDHFSNYVVAEQATSTENTNTDTTETKTENTNTDRELDNTPKTGEETNVISVVATIVSVISALGLAVIKKF